MYRAVVHRTPRGSLTSGGAPSSLDSARSSFRAPGRRDLASRRLFAMERIEVHRSSTRGHGIASAAAAVRGPSGRGGVSEAHLPAEQSQASQAPRVPSPDVDESRPSGARRPAPQGPTPAVGLSRLHGRSSHAAVRRHGRRVRSGPLSVTMLLASPAAGRGAGRSRLGHRPTGRHRRRPQPPPAPTAGAARRRSTSVTPLPPRRVRVPGRPVRRRLTSDRAVGAPARAGRRRAASGAGMSAGARVIRRTVLLYQTVRGRPAVAVPLRPELLHLRPRGRRDARRGAGLCARRATGVPLPSVGRTRIRPGA